MQCKIKVNPLNIPNFAIHFFKIPPLDLGVAAPSELTRGTLPGAGSGTGEALVGSWIG